MLMLLLGLAFADPNQGKATYVAKCQACHGPQGKGDGPAARALPKPPRDFTSAEFWSGQTSEKLRSTITTGKPGSAMRGFKMSEGQLDALVMYIETLRPTD